MPTDHHPQQKESRVCRTSSGAWLLGAARQQPGGPLVVVWDNLNARVSANPED